MIELRNETIWFEQRKFEEAESHYQRSLVQKGPQGPVEQSSSKTLPSFQSPPRSSIVNQIAEARETIKRTLEQERERSDESPSSSVGQRLSNLERENQQLKEVIKNIQTSLTNLEERVAKIEISKGAGSETAASAKEEQAKSVSQPKSKNDDEDEDSEDEDLFGSDDEEEQEKLKQIRIEQYEAKKSKKPAVIAKSNIILDVKPWDDETDMVKLEECVRSVEKDGLLWGKSKLVAVGYGIKKLQIACVVEDDKVGTDDLEEAITKFEDYIQSVDIVAFNKV